MAWNEPIKQSEITTEITGATVDFANRFGEYLADNRNKDAMTTTQLRRFFGEVKRQQMVGFNKTDFVLLKPKLAYAVGRSKKDNKIKDFYNVMTKAIDYVENEEQFKRFVKLFEAIVAYHKNYSLK